MAYTMKFQRERYAKVGEMAEALMSEYLDETWAFQIGNTFELSAGCDWEARVIMLARWHVMSGDDFSLKNSLLHEVAHALQPWSKDGPETDGHDDAWAATARSLGCNVFWGYERDAALPFRAECPRGHISTFLRVPRLQPGHWWKCMKCDDAGTVVRIHFHRVDPQPKWSSYAVMEGLLHTRDSDKSDWTRS